MDGCAISTAKHLETPLGDLVVDQTVAADLLSSGAFEAMSQSVDEDEHRHALESLYHLLMLAVVDSILYLNAFSNASSCSSAIRYTSSTATLLILSLA
jgi:predicted class III extradiol MEMO1 family dioxygenase